ncbi:MAG: hybrid sensor histidine kinase/response regulator [Chlorobi bacterium]|nr:hybrid sensor histidine kinase/response regulator [Chlorobiota bacterium]
MKKILVIDDAEFILESTSTLLKFEGYEVFTASDGDIGVKMAFEKNPDLILCDISMPKMTGYEVLDKIRNNVHTATVPFLFLTALNEKVNMRVGMEKGADDYIVKPFTRDELLNAIDAQWKKHHLIEQHVQTRVNEVGKNVTYALPHEFRTALNEVIGNAKYLGQTAENIAKEEIQEIASDIVSSANRLLKITENFLTYVRIESFAINPEKRRQLRTFYTEEPIALVKDLTNVIASKYNRKNDLIIDGYDGMINIEISSESFCKIINEIVDNAFRFSNEGEKVNINLFKKDDFLFFEIEDNGRGMSVNQINTIAVLTQFERKIYEQQGVGLGLIISKRLVEIHDGEFKIDSDSINGQGTKITFSLPIQK